MDICTGWIIVSHNSFIMVHFHLTVFPLSFAALGYNLLPDYIRLCCYDRHGNQVMYLNSSFLMSPVTLVINNDRQCDCDKDNAVPTMASTLSTASADADCNSDWQLQPQWIAAWTLTVTVISMKSMRGHCDWDKNNDSHYDYECNKNIDSHYNYHKTIALGSVKQ